jgi:hypothetical protein
MCIDLENARKRTGILLKVKFMRRVFPNVQHSCLEYRFSKLTNLSTSFFYSKTNEMHYFLKFILFCSNTLHVSDGLSVHYQESKTVHTASDICQTDSADCLLEETIFSVLIPLANSQQNLFDVYLMLYV